MSDNFGTGYPRIDMRFPHVAPVLGAQPLIREPERVVESALIDAPVAGPQPGVRPDPWPEVAVGVATAALSGAITGGVAAGSWAGAGIGAGVCSTTWSGWTFLGSYRELGPKAKTVLGVSALAGLAAVGFGVWQRNRRRGG